MMNRLRDLGIEVAGWALLALAVVFSPLPIVPSLFLLAALLILSSRYSWASRLLQAARKLIPVSRRRSAEKANVATS